MIGIDVSNHQRLVDWRAVAAWRGPNGERIEFAGMRATEGTPSSHPTYGLDAYLARNWAGAKAFGIRRIAYHVAAPSRNTPQAELDWHRSQVRYLPGDGAMLDLEDLDAVGDLCGWASAWVKGFRDAEGFGPLFYSGQWYMRPHGLIGCSGLAACGLVLADYTHAPHVAAPPPPWPLTAITQYTDVGSVAGVSTSVDMDYFDGDAAALARYFKPGGTITPTLYNQLDMSPGRLGTCAGIERSLYGCYVASTAMMATDFGHPVTPDDINREYTNRGLYFNGCDSTDDAITRLYPDIRVVSRDDYPGAADLSKCLTAPGEACILQFDGFALGLGFRTHYMYLVWWDGSTLAAHNPWGGVRVDYDAATAARLITGIIKYRRGSAAPVPAPAPAAPPAGGNSLGSAAYRPGSWQLHNVWIGQDDKVYWIWGDGTGGIVNGPTGQREVRGNLPANLKLVPGSAEIGADPFAKGFTLKVVTSDGRQWIAASTFGDGAPETWPVSPWGFIGNNPWEAVTAISPKGDPGLAGPPGAPGPPGPGVDDARIGAVAKAAVAAAITGARP